MYRILIVEDDPGIAEAIAEQAKMWDLDTACVQDFRHVMAEFAAYNPHLVLLDIVLPFFNGYHWCQEIRQVSKVPVIFISSASDNMNIVMAMNMGPMISLPSPLTRVCSLPKSRPCSGAPTTLAGRCHTGAQGGTAQHRGQQPDLPGAADFPDQKRVPDPADADGEQGKGGQPGSG